MSEKKIKVLKLLAFIISGIFVVIGLPFLAYLLSWYIDKHIGIQAFIQFPYNLIIGVIIIAIGMFFALWSNYTLFKKGKGTPVPTKATHTQKVVTKGPYKYSRNPMVFGTILYYLGLGVILNSLFFTLVFTSIISVSLYILVKLWEENNLEKRFGEEYLEYKKRTSMIIPFPSKN